ncbi:nucleotide pyrophosphohydrolase [Alkalibacillus almallahensis]|uniref:nucleotide pyrophosphohydrolase n=1 Tax=Alkalibacillus almallahensis TaxID=1379154 RepID=UPI00142090E9|nr:nucleotide pyrophosphohydrolase [Alkalibacillus almallahensis]NIK13431.1 NTP pyrophosphatase (non-canonical NTP hydrolase) [Alkalibacillus almallahensis]
MNNLNQLIQSINEFRDARNWRQYHNPKDLAVSISIEAAELLEDFQWKNSEQALEDNMENIQEEIADVLIYTMMLSSDLDLDIEEIVTKKLEKNAEKYPT